MSNLIKHISDDSFDADVLQSSVPVLLDFWAEWCAPCRTLAPTLDQVAEELKGKLTVAKINIDDHKAIANQFAIRGIPTLLLFKDGELVTTKVGPPSKSQLMSLIEPHLD